jgi:deoxyribonuclease-1
MIRALNCKSRNDCYRNNKKFAAMEADMHNLYPVLLDLSNDFHLSDFGEIPGENWRVDDCDFERKNGVVEPRVLARGNVARSIFYMHARYDLPVDKKTLKMLKQWNQDDPPSSQETERNDKIEKIQGNRNAYIDNPALANKLVPD